MLGKLLAAGLLASLAFAQGGRSRGGGMGGDESGMPEIRRAQPTKAQVLADKLKLDKDQRQELQNILMAAVEEVNPLRNQMGQARVQMAGALIEGKGEGAIKQAQDAYGALAAQLAGVEAKTFAKVYALLKPNQQSRATQNYDLLAELFEQSGGRGRGASGGGAGQGRGERER